jgi:hypothetical protein
MPTGKNWFNLIIVTLGFILYIYAITLLSSLKEIRDHWPLYRCNPMYMPLAPNIEENFVYCIQGMQSDFMGYILEPLSFIVSTVGGSIGSSLNQVNFVRAMIDKIRNFLSGGVSGVYSVFLNLVIEFQKITNGIMDIIGKMVGVLVTFMNILDGSIMTVQSAWNGPPGQMVQALGSCFLPETKIKLKNGTIVSIKDINLGDILENGSRVHSIMKIDNTQEKEDIYIIKGIGVDGADIYVTGSHLVYDKNVNKFIKVKDYSKSVKSNIDADYFNCLITSDHKIHIGKEIFWDWEDHFIKKI